MNILVLNCGSSSLKFQLIVTDLKSIEQNTDKRLAKGVIERIGSEELITTQAGDNPPERQALPIRDHLAAVDYVLRWIVSPDSKLEGFQSIADIHAVGHRVVHGGEKFRASVLITVDVIKG